MSSGDFDESNLNCYYFKGLKHEDATGILKDEDAGVFLVRDSTTRGGYVICVKEKSGVMEYLVSTHESGKLFIRPEFHFKDLAALLSFYKRNMFTSTALIRPVAKEKVRRHTQHFENNELSPSQRRTILPIPDIQMDWATTTASARQSAPPTTTRVSGDNLPPLYAKVIQERTPIAYDVQALPLKVGDIIRITRRSNGQGYGELLSGEKAKRGHFPLTHVEILKDFEKVEKLSF